MKKNFIKIGVIGMALVFALGVSFNAMAMEPAATVTPTPQVKTAVASKVITDSATRIDMSKLPVSAQKALKDLKNTKKNLTVAQMTAMKTTMIAFFKVEIQKLVDSNVLTAELAAKLLNHEKGVEVVLTATQKDAVKAAAIQACKDTLIKLEKDGTITKAQADKLALLKMGDKGHGFAFGHYKNGHHKMMNNNGHNKMMNKNVNYKNGHNKMMNKNVNYKNGHDKMMNNNGLGHKDFKGMNSGN